MNYELNRIEAAFSPKPSFVEIFNERLNNLPLLDENALFSSPLYQELPEGTRVKRYAPAIIFITGEDEDLAHAQCDFDVWLGSPHLLNSTFPHDELTRDMKSYAIRYNLNSSKVASAYIFEVDESQRLLVLDIKDAQPSQDQIDTFELERRQWALMARKYAFLNIYGDFPSIEDGLENVTRILTSNVVGKIREDEYLRGIAQTYHMTNFEWMRFRSMVLAAKDGMIRFTYDDLAEKSKLFD